LIFGMKNENVLFGEKTIMRNVK